MNDTTMGPAWFQAGKIHEILFVQEFLQQMPLLFYEGNFYGQDGLMDKDQVKEAIFSMLKMEVCSGLARKTDQLYQVLSYAAYVPALSSAPDTIHVKNGSLHLDGTFTTEHDICLSRLPVTYVPDAPEPVRWKAFLSELLEEEDILTLQEYLGYCLIATTKGQVMLFIIGDGGEGKSRITQICRAMLGDNMNVSSFHKLETNRFARADLVGKLLMVDDDLLMGALPSTNHIKMIVTQEGKIDVERKREQSVQRQMTCRLLCLGNGSPSALYDHSNGFYRRQIILTTKRRPDDRVDDPFLSEKLLGELEGIFLWCFAGLQRLIANDYRFTVSDRAKQNLEDLKTEGNNTALFLSSEGYITFDAEGSATAADLYRAYALWCRENAERTISLRSFSMYLKQHSIQYGLLASNNIQNRDGRKVRGFQGIRVDVRTDFVPYEEDTPFRDP